MKIIKGYLGLILFISSFLLFVACSGDDGPVVGPINSELKLIADKSVIEPFEKLTVSVDMPLNEYNVVFDSVVYKCNGVWWDGILTYPYDKDPRIAYFTDYRLGKEKIYVYGYKDGDIVSEEFIEYEVQKPQTDFFLLKWENAEKDIARYYITPPHYIYEGSKWTFFVSAIKVYNNVEYTKNKYAVLEVILGRGIFLYPDLNIQPQKDKYEGALPDIEGVDYYDKYQEYTKGYSKEVLPILQRFYSDFITLTYGKSELRYDGKDITKTNLWSEYDKLFENRLDIIYSNLYPVEIWETPTSCICLAMTDYGYPFIIAEPITK